MTLPCVGERVVEAFTNVLKWLTSTIRSHKYTLQGPNADFKYAIYSYLYGAFMLPTI